MSWQNIHRRGRPSPWLSDRVTWGAHERAVERGDQTESRRIFCTNSRVIDEREQKTPRQGKRQTSCRRRIQVMIKDDMCFAGAHRDVTATRASSERVEPHIGGKWNRLQHSLIFRYANLPKRLKAKIVGTLSGPIRITAAKAVGTASSYKEVTELITLEIIPVV